MRESRLLSLQITLRFGVLGSLELAINQMFCLDVQLEVETTLMQSAERFEAFIANWSALCEVVFTANGRSSIGKRILQ